MNITRRLLNLAHDSRFALAATILTGFLGGLLTIGQASALSRVVERVFLGGQALPSVTGLIGLILVFIFLRSALTWVSEVSARAIAVRVKSDLRQRLFDKILSLGPAYVRGERTGELVNTAIEGVEALDAWFSQYLPQLLLAALVPFCILFFVFPHDPLSGLILLVTAPLIPVFMYLIGKAAEALTRRRWDTLSRLSAHFLDSLQGLATLKELGRSKEQADSIAEASDRFRDVTLRVLRVTFLSALVLELVATISTALVAVEVGLRLLYGHLAFQPALFLLLLAPEFYLPLRMLGLRFHAGMSGTTAARRIFEILDMEEPGNQELGIREQVFPLDPLSPVPELPDCLITLNNLSYTYPGETEPTLRDLTLEIQAGEHIALVGASGVGKSTLVALLLRFMEPGSGKISINGRLFTEISLESWRYLIAWVPQNPFLFHDTIAANLRLAKPEATDEELTAAVRLAHLEAFIESLPAGFETRIGEQGARLSAGQAQRLALARAFLKNAPILILDEPTSDLDPQQEALVERSVRVLMRDRTVITIAHRLNTIFQADKIFLLDGGRIIESGSHNELMAKGGMYTEMVNPGAESHKSNVGTDDGPLTTDDGPLTIDRDNSLNLQSKINNPQSLILPRLLSFLRGSWSWVALSVFLGILTVGSNVGLMGTSAFLISSAALHPELGALQVAIVGVRFFGIARGVFRYLERLSTHDVTFRLLARLRGWFYRALEPLAPARLMQYRSGDLLGRIVSDVESLENFYVRVVSPTLVAALVATGMTVFFGHFAASLAWTYLAFQLLLGLGIPLLVSALTGEPGAELVSRRSAMQARLVDGIQGLADLLVFNRGKDYGQRLLDDQRMFDQTQDRMAILAGLSSASTLLLVNLGMLAVLVLAIPLVRIGQIPGVMLAVLALAAAAGFEAVMPLPMAAQMLSSNRQAARRLFEIVDAVPAVSDHQKGDREQGTGGRLRELSPSLQFSKVNFSYPSSGELALQEIDFSLPPGHRIAIVGPSGAGKSTLANLLLRFWDYSDGQILLNDHDLHEYPQEQVRGLFSFISQRAYFFNDTIRKNLLLARPAATESELQAAAQQAQIHEFIARLPRGYETVIGEHGYRLSGGERQRLAIARAYLKAAPIFLLDEPTANLDPLTESRVLETLFELGRSRSMLLITHRLVGLEAMDEILVLDQGRILEHGTQAGLLSKAGLYRSLWNMQNRILEV